MFMFQLTCTWSKQDANGQMHLAELLITVTYIHTLMYKVLPICYKPELLFTVLLTFTELKKGFYE